MRIGSLALIKILVPASLMGIQFGYRDPTQLWLVDRYGELLLVMRLGQFHAFWLLLSLNPKMSLEGTHVEGLISSWWASSDNCTIGCQLY